MNRQALIFSLLLAAAATVHASPGPGGAPERLEFVHDLYGRLYVDIRWDPRTSTLSYRGSRDRVHERWDRRPSPADWAAFWEAMDAAGVWEWRPRYVGEWQLHCERFRLVVEHGGRSVSSEGCDHFPAAESFERVQAALTRLRGTDQAAADHALDLAGRLKAASDWAEGMKAINALVEMGPGAAPAVPVLVGLLGVAPDTPRRLAAPGPEPIAAARAVVLLARQAEDAARHGSWDQAITLYDVVLARDPQHEEAATGRANAIALRESARRRAGGLGPPPPKPPLDPRRPARLAEAAETALAAIGEPAAKPLVQALVGPNPHRRRRAAQVLGRMGPHASAAVPALTRALGDPALRYVAAEALLRLDPRNAARHLEVLAVGLRHAEGDVARLCVSAIADLGTREVVPLLVQALDDDRTHSQAVSGLARIGPPAAVAVPALIHGLSDGRPLRRGHAAEALGKIGPASAGAVPALVELLRADVDGTVRIAAVRALVEMGPAAAALAIPVLVDSLRYGDERYGVGREAAIGLGRIGAPAVPALTSALGGGGLGPATPMTPHSYDGPVYADAENVRVNAASALQSIGAAAQPAVAALRTALYDRSPRVRAAAGRALSAIGTP